jgi:hypothetical protein
MTSNYLCLLDIFKRGDNDYEQFLEAPVEYGRTYLEPQLNLATLRDWLNVQKFSSVQAQTTPGTPTRHCAPG